MVRDGRFVTGGGVTAGVDFALSLVAEIAGPTVAQAIQLAVEYAPDPPFQSGRPEQAPPEILERVRRFYDAAMDERRAAAVAAATRLKGEVAPA